eukprot:m.314827 g.314827  ORF g.314827 m.314827 type:complete len:362 (-) comp16496_c1_seq8:126-1211(-)
MSRSLCKSVTLLSRHLLLKRITHPLVYNNKRHAGVLSSVAETIGNTPLVDLSRLTKSYNLEGRILAKLEYFNPGFSKKDRIAKQIVEDAIAEGKLTPGDTVVELTSGNTGTGLAIVCAVNNLKFVAVMSKGNSEERARMMHALGAEVILVPQLSESIVGQVSGGDLQEVEKVCQQIVEEREAFRADQFQLMGNFKAHYDNTGPEIWNQTNGNFDCFVDFVGSGGTYAGCAAYFQDISEGRIHNFIVEPEGAAVLAEKYENKQFKTSAHSIQGGGYSMDDLVFIDKALPATYGYISVNDTDAKTTARALAREEGIFGGFSGGANVFAAIKLLENEEYKGKTIVAVVCDSGLKYLSTDLWQSP